MQHDVMTAVVQMNSTADYAQNMATAERMIRQAAEAGAQLILLPEVFNRIDRFDQMVRHAEPIPGPTSEALSRLAQQLHLVIYAGSICERSDDPNRGYNTGLLLEADGHLLAVYRKIHLFDVAIPDGVAITESRHICAGDRVIAADTSLGRLGMATCYDLRFPELFRQLADADCEIVCIPSAFTKVTGQQHWHTLVKARAIENQCYVLAANQVGPHVTHQSYGHSLVIDPWGQVLAEGDGDHETLLLAKLSPQRLLEIKSQLPALKHRKLRAETSACVVKRDNRI